MAFDTSVVGSDEWWVAKLTSEMGAGFKRLGRLRSYREGDAILPLNSQSDAERDAWLRFLTMSRMHVVELLRDARVSKMRVTGFRTGAADDENGDASAYRVWRSSQMPSRQAVMFADLADYGREFIISDGPDVAGELPSLRFANGWTVNAHRDIRRDWLTDVAIEVGFNAEWGADVVKLWRRDAEGRVYARLAVREVGLVSSIPTDGKVWSPGSDWQWRSLSGEGEGPVFLPLSMVPVHEMRTVTGAGIWERHIDTVDRINYLTMQLMQIVATQAFRQAAVSSDDLPNVWPEGTALAGQEVDYNKLFKLGPGAVWRLPGDGKLQQFTPVDPGPIRAMRDDEIRKLAALTSTPFYMLSSDSANNSAEGANLARESGSDQTQTLIDSSETAISQALASSFEWMGDTVRSDASQIETLWAALRRPSMGEMGDAATKVKSGGATQRWIDRNVFGMTPMEMAQAQIDRESEAVFDAVE